MAIATQCSACGAALRLKDELAGKNIKCPRCGEVFRVASENSAIATTPLKAPSKPPAALADDAPEAQTLPADNLDFRDRDGDRNRDRGRDRDRDPERDDDDEEDRPRSRRGRSRGGRIGYKPCPKCEATGAERVLWTPWGSFYGSALLSHVRCPECGYKYNGRTGRSNLLPAIVFVSIPLILIAAILGVLYWYVFIWRYR